MKTGDVDPPLLRHEESDENEDSNSVESDVSEEALSSITIADGSDVKQHSMAVLIAVIATIVTYFHLNSKYDTINTPLQTTISKGAGDVPHHLGYRRTAGLNFCPEDEYDMTNTDGIKRHQFIFSSKLKSTMVSHFEIDDEADASYSQQNADANIQCLHDTTGPNIRGSAPVFMDPDIETFYMLSPPKGHIPGKKIKVVSPSFTGFAAKFYNLSPHTLNLWWDGGMDEDKGRKIGEVGPFESIGTATHNGQSFRFSPTYDNAHAIIRLIATADDPVLVYDPIKEGKNIKLSEEEQQLYDIQLLNLEYARDYLVKSGRPWLSAFPRPPPMHHMYSADYFGQKHKVVTKQTHFASLPPNMSRLTLDDYSPMISSLQDYRDKAESLSLYLKTVSCSPRVFEIENFLSSTEVDHILDLSRSHPFSASTTNSHSSIRGEEDRRTRSSTNAWVYRETSPIIDAIYRRAADVLQIDESLLRDRPGHTQTELDSDHSIAEALQLVHYDVGEQYTAHHDPIYPSVKNRFQPCRFATILFYLNDGMEGGKTTFPRSVSATYHSGLEITPQKGKAVLFYNMLPDGNIDDLSQHASTLVEKGEKWMANLWVWDPIIN